MAQFEEKGIKIVIFGWWLYVAMSQKVAYFSYFYVRSRFVFVLSSVRLKYLIIRQKAYDKKRGHTEIIQFKC